MSTLHFRGWSGLAVLLLIALAPPRLPADDGVPAEPLRGLVLDSTMTRGLADKPAEHRSIRKWIATRFSLNRQDNKLDIRVHEFRNIVIEGDDRRSDADFTRDRLVVSDGAKTTTTALEAAPPRLRETLETLGRTTARITTGRDGVETGRQILSPASTLVPLPFYLDWIVALQNLLPSDPTTRSWTMPITAHVDLGFTIAGDLLFTRLPVAADGTVPVQVVAKLDVEHFNDKIHIRASRAELTGRLVFDPKTREAKSARYDIAMSFEYANPKEPGVIVGHAKLSAWLDDSARLPEPPLRAE